MNFHYFDACAHIPIGSLNLHYLWWDEKLNFWGEAQIPIAANMVAGLGGKSIPEQIKDAIYDEIHPPGIISVFEMTTVPRAVADQAMKSSKIFYKIPGVLITESVGKPAAQMTQTGKHKCTCPKEVWLNGCKCGGQ